MTALLAAAFAAGMISTVNPCGFAMLPAYLGYFIGERSPSRRSALAVGFTVSLGFVAVFMVAGIVVASGVRVIIEWIPWLALAVGVGLMVIGVAELRGLHVFARLPGVKRSSRDNSFRGLVGFGASYGIASLSCTLPIFLSLIAAAVAGGSFLQSLSVFAAYGAGMALVVMVLTLGLAVGRDRVLRAIRPLAAHLGKISGWILLLAGGFIVWYWVTVLSSGATALTGNPVARTFEQVASYAANLVADHLVLSIAVLVGLGIAAWVAIRGRSTNEPKTEVGLAPAAEREDR
jgi:cytochrome c-type biogenesis protein